MKRVFKVDKATGKVVQVKPAPKPKASGPAIHVKGEKTIGKLR